MTLRSTGAVYLGQETSVASGKNRRFTAIIMAFVSLALLAMGTALALPTQEAKNPIAPSASAAGFCTLGAGMEDPGGWKASNTYPGGSQSRYLTGEEVFGENVFFVNYNGEGDGDFLMKKTPKNRADAYTSPDNKTKLLDHRGFMTCFGGNITVGIGNGLLGIASTMTDLTTTFSRYAFKADLICPSATQTTGNCFNILKVIGGTQNGVSDDGIIGALTSSIYLPLLVLVVLATAAWIFWIGLVKRRLREALWGAIWLVFASIAGLALLLRPAALVSAPQQVSNTLAGCVISAFSGGNCVTGSSAGPSGAGTTLNSSQVCYADGGNANERMEIVATSLSCSVWKAFVLEPYAQGSFGQSFENLDTSNKTPGGSVIKNAIRDSEKYAGQSNLFCVSLRSSGGVNSMTADNTIRLSSPGNGKKICNIALYQLFLKTQATHDGAGGKPVMANGIDTRWYSIVDVTASNDQLWGSWSSSPGKVQNGALAALAAILGGTLLLLVSLLAMVYYISSIILMAFAPLFFLFGVHPGKGRDMLKGFGEMVVSNILKYMASAIFLIIALALYGAVLGSSQSVVLSLLFVLILSFALFIYRSEIINLIGRVNMGGEKLSSSFVDGVSKSGREWRRTGGIVAGTAAGSMVKAASDAGLKETLKGNADIMGAGGQGAMSGFKREAIKPGGPLGKAGSAAFRGFDNYNGQLSRNADSAVDAAKATRDSANARLADPRSSYANLDRDLGNLAGSVGREEELAAALPSAERRIAATSPAEIRAIMETMAGGKSYMVAQDHQATINSLEGDRMAAAEAGDRESVLRIEGEIQATTASKDAVIGSIPEADFQAVDQTYNGLMSEHERAIDGFNAGHAEYLDRRTENVDSRGKVENMIISLKADTAASAEAEIRERVLTDWKTENGSTGIMNKNVMEGLEKTIAEQSAAAIAARHAAIDSKYADTLRATMGTGVSYDEGHGRVEILKAQGLATEAQTVAVKLTEVQRERAQAVTALAEATKELEKANEDLKSASATVRADAKRIHEVATEQITLQQELIKVADEREAKGQEYVRKRRAGAAELREAAKVAKPTRILIGKPNTGPEQLSLPDL